MSSSDTCAPEVRERAVRLGFEHRDEHGSERLRVSTSTQAERDNMEEGLLARSHPGTSPRIRLRLATQVPQRLRRTPELLRDRTDRSPARDWPGRVGSFVAAATRTSRASSSFSHLRRCSVRRRIPLLGCPHLLLAVRERALTVHKPPPHLLLKHPQPGFTGVAEHRCQLMVDQRGDCSPHANPAASQ